MQTMIHTIRITTTTLGTIITTVISGDLVDVDEVGGCVVVPEITKTPVIQFI
jgi:hypothetical protein